MTEKRFRSRVINKHDIEANWKLAVNFKPLIGEWIVYDPDENYDYARFKMGDGETFVNDLPFCNDVITEEDVDQMVGSPVGNLPDNDQEAIVQQVIAALGTPVFGTVDDENSIILTGTLPDGTYTLKYETAEGEHVEVGVIEIGGVEVINQLSISTDTDGSAYNGIGYQAATRISSGGAAVAYNETYASGFIPVKAGDTLFFRDVVAYCGGDNNVANHRVAVYDSAKTFLGETSFWYLCQTSNVDAGNAAYSAWNVPTYIKLTDVVTSSTTGVDNWNGKLANVAYVRLSVLEFTDQSAITINAPLE